MKKLYNKSDLERPKGVNKITSIYRTANDMVKEKRVIVTSKDLKKFIKNREKYDVK